MFATCISYSFKDILTDPIKNLKDFVQQCFRKDVGSSSQVDSTAGDCGSIF